VVAEVSRRVAADYLEADGESLKFVRSMDA
jgi:hypothetical protein